jgi:hypothetical protein
MSAGRPQLLDFYTKIRAVSRDAFAARRTLSGSCAHW